MIDRELFEVYLEGDVVSVAGEIDVHAAPHLGRALEAALESALELGSPRVVADLSAVEFIDAAGLGVVLDARDRAAAASARLVVRRPSPAVRRILDILGERVALDLE